MPGLGTIPDAPLLGIGGTWFGTLLLASESSVGTFAAFAVGHTTSMDGGVRVNTLKGIVQVSTAVFARNTVPGEWNIGAEFFARKHTVLTRSSIPEMLTAYSEALTISDADERTSALADATKSSSSIGELVCAGLESMHRGETLADESRGKTLDSDIVALMAAGELPENQNRDTLKAAKLTVWRTYDLAPTDQSE